MNDPLEGEGLVNVLKVTEALNGCSSDYKRFLEDRVTKLREYAATIPHDHGGGWAGIEEAHFDFLARARCAWCWYAADHESNAMWQSFAREGVAITTHIDVLRGSLPSDKEFLIGDIRYFDRDPNREKSTAQSEEKSYADIVLRPFLAKGREFREEQEVRVVTRCLPSQENLTIPINQPEKLIREIVIYPHKDRKTFAATRGVVVDVLRSQFPGGTDREESSGEHVRLFTVGLGKDASQIRIAPSSIQAPLYEQAEQDERLQQLVSRFGLPSQEAAPDEDKTIDSFTL